MPVPESSPEKLTPVEVETPTTDAKPSTAESSAADEGEKKGDMLSAVKAALESSKEKSPSSEATGSQSEQSADVPEEETEDDETDDFSEEELTRLKSKTRKRIEGLLTSNATLRGELARSQPGAEQYEKIRSYVTQNNLQDGEVAQLFQVGAALKNSPREAYAIIRPIYERLQQMFGDVLPPDLQQEVARGRMTAPAAKQMVAARTEAAIARQQVDTHTQRETQQRYAEATRAFVGTVSSAVTEWETAKEKADPDWKLKQPRIEEKIKLAMHERGYPKTTKAAVELADEALKAVNKELRNVLPKRPAITPKTDVASSTAVAKPKNMLEAARLGLAATRR